MAYTAPAKATVCVVGGLGNCSASNSFNGGGATKAAWDANSPTDFIGTNGASISSSAACSFTTATKNFSATNIGLNIIAGTLAYVFSGDGSHVTPGIYEVTTVTDNDNIVMANVDDDGNNDTNVFVACGGALPDIQSTLDNALNNGVSYNRYIYYNGSQNDGIGQETIGAQIDADTYGGSTTSTVAVIGYNSTLTAPSNTMTLTTTTDLGTDSLLKITTVDYLTFKYIAFNGGGKDSNKAYRCVYSPSTTDGQYTIFEHCLFSGAELDGVDFDGIGAMFVYCAFSANGRYGFTSDAYYAITGLLSCSIHDNDNSGVNWRPGLGVMSNCLIYDNGKDGTGHGVADLGGRNVIYKNNTIYKHPGNGMDFSGATRMNVVYNNKVVTSGGYSYDTNGGGNMFMYFGYNLSAVATTDHTDAVAGAAFVDFADGNNVASSQTADQLFKTITDGSEDLTPETGSDSINAGLGRTQ
jgi:hypothetical protein